MLAGWSGKHLLKLEPGVPPIAGKVQVRAQGLDNAFAQCVINSPCRTATHRRQSDAVHQGPTKSTETTGGSQITQRLLSSVSMKICTRWNRITPARPTSSTHSCLCLDQTLGTHNSVQVLRLQVTEQCCRYTRDGGGIWDVHTCSRERESCLQIVGHLWDLVSSTPSLVSATPHSHPHSNSSMPQPAWH